MRAILCASLASLALAGMSNLVSAASLQVTPTTAEIVAGNSATTLTLQNPGKFPLKAQIRVMRWSLVNGEDHLEPATEVVASPPMMSIKPNADYVVRLVRLSKQPVAAEETYRVLVDEIPDPAQRAAGTVTLAFRYSIPVFFLAGPAAKSDLTWSFQSRSGKIFVSATNTGTRRVRLADLRIDNGKGKPLMITKGLAGYVLARSSKSWVAPGGAVLSAGVPLQVTAMGDLGPINARALPEAPR